MMKYLLLQNVWGGSRCIAKGGRCIAEGVRFIAVPFV